MKRDIGLACAALAAGIYLTLAVERGYPALYAAGSIWLLLVVIYIRERRA